MYSLLRTLGYPGELFLELVYFCVLELSDMCRVNLLQRVSETFFFFVHAFRDEYIIFRCVGDAAAVDFLADIC